METYSAEITYYDDELDREFIIPSFENVTPELLREQFDDSVYRAIMASLEELASRSEWKHVPCFSMNGVIFEIDRGLHEEHLNNCLSYFTRTEEYELCSKLVSLKDKLS